ncbi:MAG: RNA 2'-phosphotransferase [Deltaproteobacteria bacterium]|nr:RNA 2'-phosphotransferase [Deltaproteobacteria bacterium]
MGRRSQQIKIENLCRYLVYILGHRPDEFGLVPDREGFVPFKVLLQAIHEEPDWSYVRRSNINEVLLGKERRLFESDDKKIRALERKWQMETDIPLQFPPRILFTAVRRRAHPVVMEKGLAPAGRKHVILSSDKDMAFRIGKRRDQQPVMLEVKAAMANEQGMLFYRFGDLYLSFDIPARFISGPPVSKEFTERRRAREEKKGKIKPKQSDLTPGSFPLHVSAFLESQKRDNQKGAARKKRKGWKEQARKIRRGKKG